MYLFALDVVFNSFLLDFPLFFVECSLDFNFSSLDLPTDLSCLSVISFDLIFWLVFLLMLLSTFCCFSFFVEFEARFYCLNLSFDTELNIIVKKLLVLLIFNLLFFLAILLLTLDPLLFTEDWLTFDVLFWVELTTLLLFHLFISLTCFRALLYFWFWSAFPLFAFRFIFLYRLKYRFEFCILRYSILSIFIVNAI